MTSSKLYGSPEGVEVIRRKKMPDGTFKEIPLGTLPGKALSAYREGGKAPTESALRAAPYTGTSPRGTEPGEARGKPAGRNPEREKGEER